MQTDLYNVHKAWSSIVLWSVGKQWLLLENYSVFEFINEQLLNSVCYLYIKFVIWDKYLTNLPTKHSSFKRSLQYMTCALSQFGKLPKPLDSPLPICISFNQRSSLSSMTLRSRRTRHCLLSNSLDKLIVLLSNMNVCFRCFKNVHYSGKNIEDCLGKLLGRNVIISSSPRLEYWKHGVK